MLSPQNHLSLPGPALSKDQSWEIQKPVVKTAEGEEGPPTGREKPRSREASSSGRVRCSPWQPPLNCGNSGNHRHPHVCLQGVLAEWYYREYPSLSASECVSCWREQYQVSGSLKPTTDM